MREYHQAYPLPINIHRFFPFIFISFYPSCGNAISEPNLPLTVRLSQLQYVRYSAVLYPFVCIHGRKLVLHLTRALAQAEWLLGKFTKSLGGGEGIAMCSTNLFG